MDGLFGGHDSHSANGLLFQLIQLQDIPRQIVEQDTPPSHFKLTLGQPALF